MILRKFFLRILSLLILILAVGVAPQLAQLISTIMDGRKQTTAKVIVITAVDCCTINR